MNCKQIALACALLVLGAVSVPAYAQTYALNTGTPTVTTGAGTLSNNDWYAEEFSLSAGQTVDSLAAYLNLNTGNTGGTLTFALYSGSSIPTRNPSPLETWTSTFNTNGWNSISTSYTASTSGDYWVAIEETTAGTTYTAPIVASTAAEPVAALAYADTTTGASAKNWATESSYPIGLQVQVEAVPEPATFGLMALGVLGTVAVARRRRGVREQR